MAKYVYKTILDLDNRNKITQLLPSGSIGIELGVATGYFSDILLSSGKFDKLYSIDRYSDHHGIDEYINAVKLLSKYNEKSCFIRSTFDEALNFFDNYFFDFIYIDAYAHNGQENGKILDDWFPKLKTHGIFSGHDYEPLVWPKTYESVNRFCNNKKLDIMVINGNQGGVNNEDQWKSWYTIKK